MRIVKYAGIWLAGLLAIMMLVNTAGFLIVKTIYHDTLMPAMAGYSAKLRFPMDEEAAADERLVSACIALRVLLDDDQMQISKGPVSDIVFTSTTIDSSVIFKRKEGLCPVSSGIFAAVYCNSVEHSSIMGNFGMIDIRALSGTPAGQALCTALEQHPAAVIRLDAYTIDKDLVVVPAKMTLLDESGSELQTISSDVTGEVIQASDCFLRNTYENEYDSTSVLHKLQTALLGERASDRLAAELADQADFTRGDYDEEKIRYGIGGFTSQRTEVRNDNTMITVQSYRYPGSLLFHTALAGGIFTVILLIVYLVRGKKYR